MPTESVDIWEETGRLVAAVRAAGEKLAFPFIAAQSDLGDPDPMSDRDGRPYAETSFSWIDRENRYWQNRRLALDSSFLLAARLTAEPFYYADGQLGSWRPTNLLSGVDCSDAAAIPDLHAAIVAPAHLPRGIVGAVVWTTPDAINVEDVFAANAEHLHALALRLISSHAEAIGRPRHAATPVNLTRREVQCLRWASVGKTNSEIGIILSLSTSTVRFHLRNAAEKLGVTSRSHAIQAAAGLGFVGSR